MVTSNRLSHIVDVLDYGDAPGYIDTSVGHTGARDFVWRDLKAKCGVDAAYFRGAVPLVAFAEVASPADLTQMHRRLWNFSRVPVLIAATPDDVSALSCFAPPLGSGTSSGPVLRSANADQRVEVVLQEFRRFGVESGNAVAAHRARFNRRTKVDRRLLDNLRRLRARLLDEGGSPSDVERLVGRSIFIRYLEDRHILSSEHFRQLAPFNNYNEVLGADPGAVSDLFNALAEHFNGDVFAPLADDTTLTPRVLASLAEFFQGGDLGSGQQALWPYDFAVIPPEVVSSIYEQLLEENQRRDAAYYTPRPLVDLVLDEVMPWDDQGVRRVLDPSCGSGIFLAEAFRRMAYRHTVVEGNAPSFEYLANLLTSSLFGVDMSEAAIGVAAFGLYLALLEHVDPPTAWREGRLPTLVGRNLLVSDFFAPHVLASQTFDLVVGNPPWQSKLSPPAARYVKGRAIGVADQQIALAFLWRSVEMLSEGGVIGMVLPAKALLHNKSTPAESARRDLFTKLDVDTVLDLSPLRKAMFGAAVSPASIIVARAHGAWAEPHETKGILHLSPRRTPLSTAVEGYVFAQDDIRQIPRQLAIALQDIWKIHLWGSSADLEFITRLRHSYPTLEDVAVKREWISGQGFQVKGGGRYDASALVGMKFLPTEAVGPLTLLVHSDERVIDPVMHRPRDIRVFRGPHVVMRNGFKDRPCSTYVEEDAAFTNGLFGLAGPVGDANALRVVAGILNSSLANYYQFMTSSSWGVEREKVELNEYLSLPLVSLTDEAIGAILSVVNDALGSRTDEDEWRSKLDEAVYAAYAMTPEEVELVQDGLTARLDEFVLGPLSPSFQPPALSALQAYMSVLAGELQRTLGSLHADVVLGDRSGGFVIVTCLFHDPLGAAKRSATSFTTADLLATSAGELEAWPSPAAIVQPSAVIVDGAQVHLVKPDQRRSWTRSKARMDASEVIGSILVARSVDV